MIDNPDNDKELIFKNDMFEIYHYVAVENNEIKCIDVVNENDFKNYFTGTKWRTGDSIRSLYEQIELMKKYHPDYSFEELNEIRDSMSNNSVKFNKRMV